MDLKSTLLINEKEVYSEKGDTMKKNIILIVLLLVVLLNVGCSKPKPRNQGFESDFNDEEREKMLEEMQLKMQEACNEKSEGDICQLTTPRGEINGTCELQEDNLICKSDQQMRRRFE